MLLNFMKSVKVYCTQRLLVIGLLGFSSGLPLLLTLSTLTWWLANKGIDKKTIGLFTLVGVPYAWKFVWAPVVDRMPIPFLTKWLGRRRGWLLFSQIILAACIFMMGFSNPTKSLENMALWAILVAFWSATQDIIIDAYRIESLKPEEYGAGAAIEVNGYRLGMMVAGAGALALSDFYDWSMVYGIMALCMGVGMITTLFCREPEHETLSRNFKLNDWLKNSVVGPFKEFVTRPGWVYVLLFVVLYKLGDNLIGPMATVFYKDLGFTGVEVGTASKFFGVWMVVLGSFMFGSVVYKWGIMRSLFIAGLIHMVANFMFFVLAEVGHDITFLYLAIAMENLSNGMMIAAFVTYLSSLCNISYTATQYALLSSFMAQTRTLGQVSSGWLADTLSWPGFFGVTILAAVPALLLLLFMMKKYPLKIDKKPA